MGKRKKKKPVEQKPVDEVEVVLSPGLEKPQDPLQDLIDIAEPSGDPQLSTKDLPEVVNSEICDVVALLPEPQTKLSQRWYGEQFLPAYTQARNKLRKLAGLT